MSDPSQAEEPLTRPEPPLPQRGEPLPQRGQALPQRGEPLPQRAGTLPQRGEPLPQRGQAAAPNGQAILPRRPSRVPRAGRHRSPHRLTVASNAPALVLAVPGPASADSEELTAEIAAAAAGFCPGVDIRVGYLAGDVQCLAEVLTTPQAEQGPTAVVVPLLAGPHPVFDAAVAAATRATRTSVMLAEHLGPHPLLAEALHARLAEAGLARAARARGLSIVTGANGVLVLADRGNEAVQAAGVIAVLLAGRLAMPVACASAGDETSVNGGMRRLREAGVSSPAIAPCVIGPETEWAEIEGIASRLGVPCARPLAAHPAVPQLVAIRYGAALADLSMASSPA